MSYGATFLNSQNKVQCGTGVLEGLFIVASGTANPGSSVSVDPSKEFLAFNRTTAGFIRGSHNTAGTVWTAENNSSSNYGAINWIKCRRISDVTAAQTGYGLNIYKSNGTSLAYSSNLAVGIDIKHIQDPQTLGSLQGANTAPYTNVNTSMPSQRIYNMSTEGTFVNYYFAPGWQQFVVTLNGQQVTGGIRQETFHFQSNFTVGIEGLFSGMIVGTSSRYRIRMLNFSSILVIKRRL